MSNDELIEYRKDIIQQIFKRSKLYINEKSVSVRLKRSAKYYDYDEEFRIYTTFFRISLLTGRIIPNACMGISDKKHYHKNKLFLNKTLSQNLGIKKLKMDLTTSKIISILAYLLYQYKYNLKGGNMK